MNPKAFLKWAMVLVLSLLVLGVAWFFLAPARITADRFLPQDTAFFLELTNPPATFRRYQGSKARKFLESEQGQALKNLVGQKIWQALDPKARLERQAYDNPFVDNPQATFSNWTLAQILDQWSRLGSEIDRYMTGETFVAVTVSDGQGPQSQGGMLLGMRPLLREKSHWELHLKIKALVEQYSLNANVGSGVHDGIAYHWIQPYPTAPRLCQGHIGPWILVSWGEQPLFDFLDRFQKKNKTPALAQESRYRTLLSMVKGGTDVFTFCNLEDLNQKGLFKEQVAPAWRRTLKFLYQDWLPLQAIAWEARFDKGLLQDRFLGLRREPLSKEKAKQDLATFENLAYTTPETSLYFSSNFKLSEAFGVLDDLDSKMPESLRQNIRTLESFFALINMDFRKNFLQALGPEFSFQIGWEPGKEIPQAALLFQVADPKSFGPTLAFVLRELQQNSPSYGAVGREKLGPYDLAITHPPAYPRLSPTLVMSEKFFGIFTTEEAARSILSRKSEASIASRIPTGWLRDSQSHSALWMDSKPFLEKSYSPLKPFVDLVIFFWMPEIFTDVEWPKSIRLPDSMGSWSMGFSYLGSEVVSVSSISDFGNQAAWLAGSLICLKLKPSPDDLFAQNVTEMLKPIPLEESSTTKVTADLVQADLNYLRFAFNFWAESQKKGNVPRWQDLAFYISSETALGRGRGKDRFGNPYKLGVVGVSEPDLDPATKAYFPDKKQDFWSPRKSPVFKSSDATSSKASPSSKPTRKPAAKR